MRSLGAAVAGMAGRGGVTDHRPPRSVGSLLGALRRRLRLGRAPLLDVPAGLWAAKEIATLIRAGVIVRPPDGLFHPDRAICRGDLAVWLARGLAGSDSALPTPSGTPTFIDVPVDDARYRSIEYAFARGVISGYADGAYRPQRPLNRGSAAVLIARALAGDNDIATHQCRGPLFPDLTQDSDDPYRECYRYVAFLAARGLVQGYPDGLYHPGYVCSRDQAAVMLSRALNQLRRR